MSPTGVIEAGNDFSDEYGEFAHLDSRRRFHNFDEIRAEILRQTDRLAGSNKGIVRHPIGLTIYSHRVPNLLLVDLPGMVKVRERQRVCVCYCMMVARSLSAMKGEGYAHGEFCLPHLSLL